MFPLYIAGAIAHLLYRRHTLSTVLDRAIPERTLINVIMLVGSLTMTHTPYTHPTWVCRTMSCAHKQKNCSDTYSNILPYINCHLQCPHWHIRSVTFPTL